VEEDAVELNQTRRLGRDVRGWIQAGVWLIVAMQWMSAAGNAQQVTAAAELRVMSFNIRYGTANDGADAWPRRRQLVVQTIRQFDPDLLGTQETLPFQATYLTQELSGYQYLGWSRDESAQGEQCGLLVRSARFEVLESGQFWLSERPDEKFSRSWDAALPRVATWARLRERSDQAKPFVFINTHFDHRGEEARRQSALVLRERLLKIAGEQPVILTGDFNCGETSPPYTTLLEGGGLRDTWLQSATNRTAESGTFHGFSGKAGAERIDWILVSPAWGVRSATIDRTNADGRYPSDHFPVTAVLGEPDRNARE
jgi:endonuclease/exonuclease/phosphatase family metal-dependent hydrolase